MGKYHVYVPEVHYQIVEIEADSMEEAVVKVHDGDGDYLNMEYSHTRNGDRQVHDLESGDRKWMDPDEVQK
jgi:hypothetical protein